MTISVSYEYGQVTTLVANLGKVSGSVVPLVGQVVDQGGKAVEKTWRSIATVTAGQHGKLYPSKIKSGGVRYGFGGASVEIKPTVAWSFEYGSINQPPHLDGAKAMDIVSPAFVAALESAAGGILAAAVGGGGGSGRVNYTTVDGRTISVTQAQADAYGASRR